MKLKLSIKSILGVVLAVIFFWVFAISIWFTNNILDRDTFVNKTTAVLETEQSRTAISNEIVGRIRQNRPIIGTITAPILSKIIVGVLDTDIFDTIYTRMAQELHLQLTTRNPRPLTIDVKDTAEFIRPLVEERNPDLIDSLPDQIVIIKENQIPSIYRFGTVLTITGPVLLIAGLVILILVFRSASSKRSFVTVLGLSLAASGFLVYYLVPAIGSSVSSLASSTNSAVIIDSLYRSFTDPLVRLSTTVLVLGSLTTVAGLFLRKDLLKLPRRK